MKVRAYVLMGLVALVSMASVSKDAKPTVGLNPGDLAPRIEFLENTDNLGSQDHSDHYTLVHFWAAYDAESRAGNVQLSNEVNKFSSDQIAMYAVSFDEKESIFAETVKADRIKGSVQLREEQGEKSELFKKFNLKKGYKNYLLNGNGMIVAVDVTPDALNKILKSI